MAKKGEKLSQETKDKIKKNHVHYWKGKTMDKKSNAKRNKSMKGIMSKSIELLKKHAKLIKKNKRYPHITKQIEGKTKLINHIVWCSQSENLSYVPKEFVIHHKDMNPRNNNIKNLLMLPWGLHSSLHNQLNNQWLKQ